MTYLITFACYGSRIHGDESGSVDRKQRVPGSRTLPEDPRRAGAERRRMDQPAYTLDAVRRAAVLETIQEVCSHRGWALLAAHVRSNHVDAVVESEVRPERVMNDFKSYASRRLTEKGLDEPGRRRWAHHGSTRWLWKPEDVSAAIQYVVNEQGDRMAVFEAQGR